MFSRQSHFTNKHQNKHQKKLIKIKGNKVYVITQPNWFYCNIGQTGKIIILIIWCIIIEVKVIEV